ncbi:MAG: hypothetical protein IJ788_05315 [Oscillospiraceae bacterium]|nr:hypothetical protein [Oscillospiraceae bacterium]
MGKRPDHKMSRADRAKQFSPFDALTGLSAALRRKRMELGMPEKGEDFDVESAGYIDFDAIPDDWYEDFESE